MSDEVIDERLPEGVTEEDLEQIVSADGEPQEEPEAEESVAVQAEEVPAEEPELDPVAQYEKEAAGLKNEIRNLRAERRQQAQAIEELRQAFLSGQQQPQQAQEPAEELDVFDRLERGIGSTAERIEQLEQRLTQNAELEARKREVESIMRFSEEKTKEFAASKPDYQQADSWLENHYRNEFREKFSDATDEQIDQALVVLRARNAAQALQQGANPAQVIYESALQAGYQAQEPTNGAAPKVTPPPRGRATQTLSRVGGGNSASAGEDPFSHDALMEAAKSEESWKRHVKAHLYKEQVA